MKPSYLYDEKSYTDNMVYTYIDMVRWASVNDSDQQIQHWIDDMYMELHFETVRYNYLCMP